MLVAIEGIDCSGKSTLTDAITNVYRARGEAIAKTREPGGSDFGESLRQLIFSEKHQLAPYTEMLLFAADRFEHMKKLEKLLRSDKTLVLSDRYIYSFIAYQHGLYTLPIELLLRLSQNLIIPGFVFYLYRNNTKNQAQYSSDPRLNLENIEVLSRVYWMSLIQIQRLESIVYAIPSYTFTLEEEIELMMILIACHT
jgi:dTMP kinase